MGKRSDFPRRKHDGYFSWDPRILPPLLPHIPDIETFFEPCVGQGDLVLQLESAGLKCTGWCDIADHGFDLPNIQDALTLTADDVGNTDAIITNPPWTRKILHPMIWHFAALRPTWLLFEAAWAFTAQATPFRDICSDIVPVPRLKWVEGSKHSAKDDCAWYRFDMTNLQPTRFHWQIK
jgi:hypothetical protein